MSLPRPGMHGNGWAILYHDPATDRLFTWGTRDDEAPRLIGVSPILALDVFEHAYMVDYGASGRGDYVGAFLSKTCSGRSWNGGSMTARGTGFLAMGFGETARVVRVDARVDGCPAGTVAVGSPTTKLDDDAGESQRQRTSRAGPTAVSCPRGGKLKSRPGHRGDGARRAGSCRATPSRHAGRRRGVRPATQRAAP